MVCVTNGADIMLEAPYVVEKKAAPGKFNGA